MLIPSFVSTVNAAAETITDEGLTRLVATPDSLGCTATQSMGMGEKYLYSIKIYSENTKAIVCRVDMEDARRTILMKNGDTGENYFTDFAHANDADLAVIDGVEYLFVLASGAIVVYEIDGRTMYWRAKYDLYYNGKTFGPSGLAVYEVDEENITFLFKWSYKTISTGKIARNQTEGSISVTIKCYLDSSAVEVNGTARDFTGFANQGVYLCGDILLATYAGCQEWETVNQSLVLGFDLSEIRPGTVPTLKPREDLIFYMESLDYPHFFEIEDCGISSDGKLYFNTNCWISTSDKNHDAVYVLNDFIMPGFESWDNPFSDVKESDWFYEDVKFVNQERLMNGTSDTAYSPDAPLTRGQIVTVLWRQAGSPAPKSKNTFTDVKADWYYTDAIAWAAENKIVEGHGDGKFAPDDSVTREQVMTILYRYAAAMGNVKDSSVSIRAYTCSEWAKSYVSWAKGNGIMEIGTDISDLTAPASRAEIAAYLTRLYQNGIEK